MKDKKDDIVKVDFAFRRELARKVEGNLASFCYQCGACVGDCPATTYSDGEFNPREHKKIVAISDINTAYFLHRKRTEMPHLQGIDGPDRFTEVNIGLDGDKLREEMERCFSCGVCDDCDNCFVFCPDVAISRKDGVYTIDYDYCKGCLICAQECPRGVISTQSEAS